MIIVPSRSITGKPKLNIANDNIYENIGYTKQNRSYDKYVQLWQSQLNVLDLSKLVSNGSGGIRWSPPFTQEYSPQTLDSDANKDIKNYRYLYGQELSNKFRIYIPNNTDNWHYFLIKVTIPKPDKNIDYSKLKFRYSDDVTYNRPYVMDGIVQIESSRLYDFVEGDTTRQIDDKYIFDESTSETEMLSHFANSDFSQIATFNTMDMFVQLRITTDNLEFYCNGAVLNGTPATQNMGGSISAIYTRNITFYYVDMQSKSENVNEDAKFTLEDNELLAQQTTVKGADIYEKIENDIISEYEFGKHSVDLTCLYMEYKNEYGEIVYSGNDGQMINIGDIIIPYYFGKDGNETPIAKYPNGEPMRFIVYKSSINANDTKYIKNEISAIEVKTFSISVSKSDTNIQSSVLLNNYSQTNSIFYANSGDIIKIPKEINLGNWTEVIVNENSYTLETNKVGIGFDGYEFIVEDKDFNINFIKSGGGTIG